MNEVKKGISTSEFQIMAGAGGYELLMQVFDKDVPLPHEAWVAIWIYLLGRALVKTAMYLSTRPTQEKV